MSQLRAGNLDAALKDSTAALRQDAKFKDPRLTHADVLARQGNYAAALGDYDEIIRLDSSCWEAYLGRGKVRAGMQAIRTSAKPIFPIRL